MRIIYEKLFRFFIMLLLEMQLLGNSSDKGLFEP